MRDRDSLILESLYHTILENNGMDAKYAELERRAKNGDEEAKAEAQRMADEAAKAAVYNVGPVWHYTNQKFNVFKQTIGSHLGFHFGTKKQAAARGRLLAGEIVPIKAYLSIKSPFRVDDAGHFGSAFNVLRAVIDARPNLSPARSDTLLDLFREYEDLATTDRAKGRDPDTENTRKPWINLLGKIKKRLELLGYDGFVYKNEVEGEGDSYVAFNTSQIKSAEPFTYDENGELIPLSQRFDSSKDDIRY